MPQSIVFVNVSTVVSSDELSACVAALQKQVSNDFAPIWNHDAVLSIADKAPTDPTQWPMIVADDSDQAGALGYHELGPSGQPVGYVFAKSTMDDGGKWTVTASHELLEMLVDPWACIVAQGIDGTLRAYEVADACEDDPFGYDIDGVTVSDFVTPAWFDASGAPFDFKGHVSAAYQILENGYIGVLGPDGWTQQTNRVATRAARQVAKPGSRRMRRKMGRFQWTISVTF